MTIKRPVAGKDVPSRPPRAEAQSSVGQPSHTSRGASSREDKIGACRTMQAKELALAAAAETQSLRVDHVYNAASWSERADLLQRIQSSFNRRDALDAAERERADAATPLAQVNRRNPMTTDSGRDGPEPVEAREVGTAGQVHQEPSSSAQNAASYGISCVKVEQFEIGGYRYTNLNDAIAEAKRRGANQVAT